MTDEKGTGKHSHKNTEEPWPHREGSEGERSESAQEHRSASSKAEVSQNERGQQKSSSSDTQDLKEREYRDAQGNVHHHTHTSQEMKEKKAS